MFKLSRLYITNAGYRLAWYEGVMLSFNDSEGDPVHTILSLVNQGGKTSMMSLFYSTFDTHRNRFLQHLSNPAHVFEDYFDANGLPAIVAVEWHVPEQDLAGAGPKLVTGQIVIRRGKEDTDPERTFFAFLAGDGLTLDSIPGDNLPGGADGTLRSREQVRAWLDRMEEKYPGRFQATENHGEWIRILMNYGLDVDALRQQVDFNRKEGAMDESFLEFKSEYEFLTRFFSLSMKADEANDVRETIAAHCRRLAKKRPYEIQREQLLKLETEFAAFVRGADEDAKAQAGSKAAERDIGIAAASLAAHAERHTQAGEREKRAAAAADEAEENHRKQHATAHRLALALTGEKHVRAVRAAEALIKKAEVDLKTAKSERDHLKAAKLLEEKERLEKSLKALEDAINAADGEVRPYREQHSRAAALLSAALTLEAQGHENAARLAQQAEQAVGRAINELRQQLTKLNQDSSDASARQARFEQRLTDAERKRKSLLNQGLLLPDETALAAMDRLRQAIEAATALAKEATERARKHELDARAAEVARAQHLVDHATRSAEAAQIGGKLDALEETRELLQHHPILSRAVDADAVEPEADGVPPALAQFILRLRQRLTTAEIDLARREEAVRSIDQTRLAGHDPDVARIVSALATAGVAGANSFASYLAEVQPSAEKARAVVLSNPGRFLGVKVANARELEEAAASLAAQNLELTRPVVVSVGAHSPEAARPGEQFVVGPNHDALYSFTAAQEALPHLAELREAAELAKAALQAELEEALQVRETLTRYLADVGVGGIAILRQQRRAAETAAADSKLAAEAAERDATRAREEAGVARTASTTHCTDANNRTRDADRVAEWLKEYGANLPKWETELASVKQELDAIAATRDEVDGKLRARDEERLGHQKAGVERAHEARKANDELRALGVTSVTSIDLDALRAAPRSLDSLRAEEKNAAAVLASVEKRAQGELVVRRDETKRQLDAAAKDYTAAARDLKEPDIRRVLGRDYAAEMETARGLEQVAQADNLKANQKLAEARTIHGEYTKGLKADKLGTNLPPLELHVLEMDDRQLASFLKTTEEAALTANTAANAARDAAAAARRSADLSKQRAQSYRQAAEGLDAPEGEALPEPDLTRFTAVEGLGEECKHLNRARTAAERTARIARDKVQGLHNRVCDLARDKEFATTEPELAERLLRNELEPALTQHEGVTAAIKNRLSTVQSELATMDKDFERAIDRLAGLVQDGLRMLRRACDGIVLPDGVPIVAGKSVLRMNKAVFSQSTEQRKQALRPVMDALAAGDTIPQSGAELAAMSILRLAPGTHGLRLQILKMVDTVDEQYVLIEKLSHSGAERISMALLLYFVNMRLRYEERASARTANGGVLMLDNPFAKATARPIWEMVIGLAKATGVQLVFTTGIKEEDTLSVFSHFLRLAKRERNETTGRTYVRVVDFEFKGEAAA